MLARVLAAVMGSAARRPLAAVLAVLALAAGGGALAALTLSPSTSTDTFVGRSSQSYEASARFHQRFGDDAIYVLVQEKLTDLVLSADVLRLVGLEGCISGNQPRGVAAPGGPDGPCAQLARTKPVKVVFGPGTFLNTSVNQITDQYTAQSRQAQQQAADAAAAARKLARKRGYSKAQQDKVAKEAEQLVSNQFAQNLVQLALKYGITSIPQLNDPGFVSKIVFDDTKPAGTPKQRFAYIFPTKDSALIQVRLKPELSESQREHAIRLIRQAVAMPKWELPTGHGRYVVTGSPVVVGDLAHTVTSSSKTLLLAALIVMALALALAFRAPLRLLPLAVALGATGITFGALAVAGASLTMASIAVLPVLLGLGVDYAIQLQARLQEEQRRGGPVEAAVRRVAARGAPTVATAAVATAAGFLALVLSPVPMVRGFGLIMVLGIAVALGSALTLGVAAQALAARRLARPAPAGGAARRGGPVTRGARAAAEALAAASRGAGELVFDSRPAGLVRRGGARAFGGAVGAALHRPGRVLAVGLVAAAAGWALDTQTRVESDIQKLVPQKLGALRDLRELEDSTGVGGEIDVVVSSDHLTDPKVIRWMSGYQGRLLERFGYKPGRGCGKAELCPAFSLPDLFNGGVGTSRSAIDALLDAVPSYFSQGVLTRDRRTASLAFGIRLMPLNHQEDVINTMRRELDPPPGVHAELAGLPVLAADANARVASSWRRVVLGLAGLLAVGLVLLAALRSRRRALVPLVPIALATGWSALVLFAIRIPLNPMSVTLGALVIAISTEFSVLLAERYRSEREGGHDVRAALERAYRSTGTAVLASGTTAIAGFAVLAVSDIRMLRDFGIVTVVDLLVSLAGVLLVLPSVLVLAERGRLALPARPQLRRGRGGRKGRGRLRRGGRSQAGEALS